MRNRFLARALALAAASATGPAIASAQNAGPLVLLLPASARAAGVGNASVAIRDEYAVFASPAQINATNGFAATFAAYGSNARAATGAAGVTVGPITLGWGVSFVDFTSPRTDRTYPLAPASLVGAGDADNFTLAAALGGQMTVKNFRIGVTGKYAEDVVARETTTSSLLVLPSRGSAWLLDVGTAHALWTGTAALAVQNIGQPYVMRGRYVSVPTQVALGWAAQRSWGPFDYGLVTQVTGRREGWVGGAAGLEMNWSWIEGFSVAGRVGAHRTETDAEHPMTAGFSFTADRLAVDYGASFFDGNKLGHRITVRWR